jgi:hypothetical protein
MSVIRLSTLGRRFVAATLTLLVAGNIGFAHPASAAPVDPGGDSFQRGCRALQSRAEELIAEYQRNGGSDPDRLKEIQSELRALGLDWRSIGCQEVFGDIVRALPKPPVSVRPGAPKLPVSNPSAVKLKPVAKPPVAKPPVVKPTTKPVAKP